MSSCFLPFKRPIEDLGTRCVGDGLQEEYTDCLVDLMRRVPIQGYEFRTLPIISSPKLQNPTTANPKTADL